jgi:hypothetical protein
MNWFLDLVSVRLELGLVLSPLVFSHSLGVDIQHSQGLLGEYLLKIG